MTMSIFSVTCAPYATTTATAAKTMKLEEISKCPTEWYEMTKTTANANATTTVPLTHLRTNAHVLWRQNRQLHADRTKSPTHHFCAHPIALSRVASTLNSRNRSQMDTPLERKLDQRTETNSSLLWSFPQRTQVQKKTDSIWPKTDPVRFHTAKTTAQTDTNAFVIKCVHSLICIMKFRAGFARAVLLSY